MWIEFVPTSIAAMRWRGIAAIMRRGRSLDREIADLRDDGLTFGPRGPVDERLHVLRRLHARVEIEKAADRILPAAHRLQRRHHRRTLVVFLHRREANPFRIRRAAEADAV